MTDSDRPPFRRLVAPVSAPEYVTIDEAYPAPLGSRPDRPWVGLCMVASIDGSTVVSGASGELSSANDSAVMLRLRTLADVIIVGSGTVTAEGYGPPKRTGLRIGVVTARGHVDATTPLFTSGAGFVITTEGADIAGDIDVIRAGTSQVDLAVAIASLGQVCDAPRFVQAEGGPTLNGALFAADVVDEINVTTSPLTVGGDGPRLAAQGPDHAHRFELAQLLTDAESFLYARWLRVRGGER